MNITNLCLSIAFILSTYVTNSSSNNKPCLSKTRFIVTGATGYIGRSVVRELVKRNIPTISVVRSTDFTEITSNYLEGSSIVVADVLDPDEIDKIMIDHDPSVSICCLASRSGIAKDAWNVDYKGGLNVLNAFSKYSTSKCPHFVLLSAFCVGKPATGFF